MAPIHAKTFHVVLTNGNEVDTDIEPVKQGQWLVVNDGTTTFTFPAHSVDHIETPTVAVTPPKS